MARWPRAPNPRASASSPAWANLSRISSWKRIAKSYTVAVGWKIASGPLVRIAKPPGSARVPFRGQGITVVRRLSGRNTVEITLTARLGGGLWDAYRLTIHVYI